MNFSFINDIDGLYRKGITVSNATGVDRFLCPVCGKEYATLTGAESHIEKRNCHTNQQLFSGTGVEANAFSLYEELSLMFFPMARTSLRIFRESRLYSPIVEFAMFCMDKKINSIIYSNWGKRQLKSKYINQFIKKMMSETTLLQYRKFLRQNEEMIDSDLFLEMNYERLQTDDGFLIDSLYRGDIGLQFAESKLDLSERVEAMDIGFQMRLEGILDETKF